LEFLAGAFPLSPEFTPDYPDHSFEELPEPIRVHIWNYTLYVREITEASEEDVKALFKRMNQNVVTLNAQELRHATYSGEFIKLMEELAEDDYWAENKIATARDIRRMTDVEFISDLFVSLMHGIQDKTKELDKYYNMYETSLPEKVKWQARFLRIRELIMAILPDLRNTRWHYKSDFYTLFIAINEALEAGDIPQRNYGRLGTALVSFANKITHAISKESSRGVVLREYLNYASAATKSTTDKNRRATRHKYVLAIISKYIKAK
jgi:hypothetical protein